MALQLYKVIGSISGPSMCFVPGDVIGLKPGDTLPPGLDGVCERLPEDIGVPVDVIRLDPAAMRAADNPRVEPVPVPPIAEEDVRKKYRMQDPELWALAQQLAFPAPTMRRMKQDREGRVKVTPLWQQPDCDHWVEKFQKLALVLGRSR